MSIPTFYYSNAFAAGTLSGTSSDEANPVRRVSDSDRTLRYTLLDSVGPDVTTGMVDVTLATASKAYTHFVMVSGYALSGWTLDVESEDTDGGNNANHQSYAMSGDEPFVLALSGLTTARRVWRARMTSTSGITDSPYIYEMMLAKQYTFPSGFKPVIGVQRTTIHNYQRLNVPGAAPFKFRLGADYERVSYSLVMPVTEVSGFISFIQENDGGEPFWHVDDKSRGYWAELRDMQVNFDDQAGIYSFSITVQEIPLET